MCNLGAALRALTEPCMSRSPIVHCHFMLHFYERINVDDYDDDDYDNFAIIAFYLGNGIRAMPVVTMEH